MIDARRERLDRPVPMVRVMDRVLPSDFEGPVFVWDIDKTYLDTRFSQLKDLAGIPFEFGSDKRALPGAIELLGALRDGAGREQRPVFFVSASPHQLAPAIERKMLLDAVEWDGITYKDPLRMLRRGHFGEIASQVPFKLGALLLLARDLPEGARFQLFGDDAEADAFAYALFADAVAGRLRGEELRRILLAHHTRPVVARDLVELAAGLTPREAVAGIHIRVERFPDGARVKPFPPFVLGHPTFGSTAATLAAAGLVSADAARAVIAASAVAAALPGEAADDGFRVPEALRRAR